MKEFIKSYKRQEGITLVALVITVVVMLILAGVAISAVVDGDGLFSKTRQAAETYENAADKEGYMLENLMGQIDHYIQDNGTGTGDDGNDPVDDNPVVKPTATLGTVVTENQTYDGRLKGRYNNPIIPKGFAPVGNAQDSTVTADAVWGSADGYQKGLVIQDGSGNQFVWIPVDGTTVNFERQTWYKSDGTTAFGKKAEECEETIPTEISTSITNNGGFYIGRYEAGIAENMPQEELSSDSSATYGTGEYKPVSQQGAIVWNRIQWGDENNDETPGNGAVTVARSMYPVDDTNYGVASTLIYGTQWDTALKFIGAYEGDAEYATDSTGKGNYYGTNGADDIDSYWNSSSNNSGSAVSGAREGFRQKNIYDMAGNVFEWTMEKPIDYSTQRTNRGGSYNFPGSDKPASYRNYDDVDNDKGYRRFSCSALYKAALNPKEKRSN